MTDILNRARTAALVALAEHGQTTDIQDLLVAGNPSRSVPPGALDAMVRAVINAMREPSIEPVRLAYKTGYGEGHFDATLDETGTGYTDHPAAEVGWQQYAAIRNLPLSETAQVDERPTG